MRSHEDVLVRLNAPVVQLGGAGLAIDLGQVVHFGLELVERDVLQLLDLADTHAQTRFLERDLDLGDPVVL